MKKYGVGIVAAVILISPIRVMACDCDDHTSSITHFKDGLSPNGPVTAEAASVDPAGCGCGPDDVHFHDYGPAHVTPPPAVPAPKKPTS
jgi:hypothetical protein